MHIPTLETQRLKLVPPDAHCEAAYAAFYTDADASREYGGPLSAGQSWARLAADLGSWHLQGFGVWAIELKTPEVDATSDASRGPILGTCGFWQGRGWPRELTWWLLPEDRGHGYALEASRAAVAHAHANLAWTEVQTYMNDSNAAARALVMRLGGRAVGRRAFPDGLSREVFVIPPAAT